MNSSISFPYRTTKKIVVFGGHKVFHKELKKLLPDVKTVESIKRGGVAPVRQADIVFLQINKVGHTAYYCVRDACTASKTRCYHLNYANAYKCAEVIVRELEKDTSLLGKDDTELCKNKNR